MEWVGGKVKEVRGGEREGTGLSMQNKRDCFKIKTTYVC